MLKVGFVGLDDISHENILGYLDLNDARVVAVCSLDRDTAERFLTKWSLMDVKIYTKVEDMLEEEELDIAEIITPHYLHAPHAVMCAEENLRVLVYRNQWHLLSVSAIKLSMRAKKNNVKLKVYENFVFYPVYLKAKRAD